MHNESQEKQLQFLSQSIRLQEQTSPRLVRATMTAVSLSVIAFIGWAAFAQVPEIAHTPGEVVPSGFQQTVQHLEGGTIREILVHEGQPVEKGQTLLRLDGDGIVQDLKRAEEQDVILAMQEERLRAFRDGRKPVFAPAAAARADLARDQQSFFSSMIEAKDREKAIIRDQIAQKKHAITTYAADLDTARRNFAITGELYQRRKELNRRGVMSDMKLLETEQSYNLLEGQTRNLSGQIAAARAEIAEYESRLKSLDADNIDDANRQLDGIIAARAQNRETIEKLKNRVARLDITAPVRGIVKGLTVNTIGSIVAPGQVLMEIVPADAPLVVALRIPPRYIGHLKPGQPVQIKSSSFDFSRYGSAPGTLEFISAATFTGENGDRYYQGRVKLARHYIGDDARNVVIPGMTVMADVITGQKTVLEYLLKPIRNAMATAFTER